MSSRDSRRHPARQVRSLSPPRTPFEDRYLAEARQICLQQIPDPRYDIFRFGSRARGRFTLLNYHSAMTHDWFSGDFAGLSPYANLGGGATVGPDSFLGMHATLGPSASLGACGKIAAPSVLLHDAPANSLAFGVPARISAGIQ